MSRIPRLAISTRVRSVAMFFLVTTSVSCGGAPPGKFDSMPVYAALLRSVADSVTDGSYLVVDRKTWAPPDGPKLLSWLHASRALVRSFRSANLQPTALPNNGLPVPLLDRSLRSIVDSQGSAAWWNGVIKFYGNRSVDLLILSRPGFSSDGATAVLHYQVYCGGRCGTAHVAELAVRDREWVVIRDVGYGIS